MFVKHLLVRASLLRDGDKAHLQHTEQVGPLVPFYDQEGKHKALHHSCLCYCGRNKAMILVVFPPSPAAMSITLQADKGVYVAALRRWPVPSCPVFTRKLSMTIFVQSGHRLTNFHSILTMILFHLSILQAVFV